MYFIIILPLGRLGTTVPGLMEKGKWPYLCAMKRLILPLAIMLTLAFLGFALTRPAEQTRTVEVDLSALKAMGYLTDSSRLIRWAVPFIGTDAVYRQDRLVKGDDTLTMVRLSAYQMDLRRSRPGDAQDFTISVSPDKDSVFKSYLTLSYWLPRWKKFRGQTLARDAEASFDSLRNFLGNPTRLYGFPIKGEPVVDTSFLFAKKTIDKKDFVAETRSLFDMLIREAGRRGAGYNGVRIFHFEDAGSNRNIYASIGITRNVETREGDPVSLKKMPYQMNLLTLDYKGLYKDLPKAYQALEDYRQDYRFVTMAIPFHKYIDEGYGFSDSSTVHMKVCYPVY